MKTYSRKKSDEHEEEIIIDLNEVCRLCMGKEVDLINIYKNDEAVPLTLRIMACVALEVFEGDGLPDKICHPCKYQLEKSYNFRKKCEQSDLKLRQHLRDFNEYSEQTIDDVDQQIDQETADLQVDENQDEDRKFIPSAGPSGLGSGVAGTTEEDLLGMTKVTYIQPDPEPNQDPENITLPTESETDKEACTLKTIQMKTEEDADGNIYIVDEEPTDDANIDAIAEAVKATLAAQPGLNLNGQFQLKVNQSNGKSTQVEVTTEDGAVIIMELMTEEDNPLALPMEMSTNDMDTDLNEDGEIQVFKCPECPKSFARRIQLRRHASVHMQQRGFSCGICEKWFPTRSALVRHERIHTGERPFQCEVCQKSFAQKEILYRHLMTHTGQKPYRCPHCPKGFTQKEPLRLHLRTHISGGNTSDIQLHYCTLCPKVFCHASGLSRHLVTHTGKTFKCDDCHKSFTDKSSLRRHHLQTKEKPFSCKEKLSNVA